MAVKNKLHTKRMYIVVIWLVLFVFGLMYKLFYIQWIQGDEFRKIAQERTVRDEGVPANRGNVYSADGSLLATSIPDYTIRFDAVAPKVENFESNVRKLSDSLALMFGNHASEWESRFRRARATKNRYMLVSKNLSYTEYVRVKNFPLFNLGANKGGIIIEQETIREHPIGKIAERTIGYQRIDEDGKIIRVGIEGAFNDYLKGVDGKQLMQKIAKNQWKPISAFNQIEPQDGYDIVSTIDVYIQDIAHHALLKQLEKYQADHGCVIVMETETGEIKAISNLGRNPNGVYYERMNYAVGESHEPGSTFKLMDMIALLDDKKADTTKIYDTNNGVVTYRGRKVKDSNGKGYGKISLGRGFELSSNTVLVQAVYDAYKDNPWQFVNRVNDMGLNKPLGLPIIGEGKPKIPQPSDKDWSPISLPWMAFGYGLSITPLQTLTLYNAVANNGEMVRPIFVKEIKNWNKTVKRFEKEIIHPKICSDEALVQIKQLLERAVKYGTGKKLYSPNFSMAGKTGTAQVNYNKGDGEMYYASSFAGFFPADHPKYSCVVVVHKPNVAKGFYGGDVAGPVFKRIAQKIYTDVPSTNEVKKINGIMERHEKQYAAYEGKAQVKSSKTPDVVGMSGMDAIALLENNGLHVRIVGNIIGKVKKQSKNPGESIGRNESITIELS
ncbi:MAG: transpeptidase family protein [Flavobacterium sp.]|nr:transpeptidase family protein [Candidatus Neoflavobacterium equi]